MDIEKTALMTPLLTSGHATECVSGTIQPSPGRDVPVEQATESDLIIDLTTAKALAVTIPESFLLRIDEVIE